MFVISSHSIHHKYHQNDVRWTKLMVEQYEDSFKHSNHDEGLSHDYHLCKNRYLLLTLRGAKSNGQSFFGQSFVLGNNPHRL